MATGVSKTRWNGDLTFQQFLKSVTTQDLGVTLSYNGKRSEKEIKDIPPANTTLLWSGDNRTKDWNNRLYYGDNLPILTRLYRDTSIFGKVSLIYIDPPFSTRSIFQLRSQVDAYCDLLEGARYIEFIRERLIFLKELLSEEGSIYIHLDENMAFYIKVIMDEIFGKNNFRNWITRKKCNPKNYTKKTFGKIADYILFYTKSDKYIWNLPVELWTAERANKEYICVEEGTGRRYKKVPLHAPGERNGETGKPWKGIKPPPGKHWQFVPRKLDEMDKRGHIYWSVNGNPRRKIYLDESNGILIQDIWTEFLDTRNQNTKITGYPTEKNPELLKRIIQASSNAGDIILDCFSGSGTFLSVGSELGRKWIGIDNSQEAIKATLKRLLVGCEPMGDYVKKRKKNVTKKEIQHLFFNSENEKLGKNNAKGKNISRNFSLLVDGLYAGELDKTIKELADIKS